MDWQRHLDTKHSTLLRREAAGFEQVNLASERLNITLPEELASLFAVTDGLTGDYGAGLVWPVSEIVSRNLELRNSTDFADLYMPFDCLLFFGDAGDGNQFGYSICGGAINRTDVFAWNHENDSRIWVAPSLQTYLDWWTTGKISI